MAFTMVFTFRVSYFNPNLFFPNVSFLSPLKPSLPLLLFFPFDIMYILLSLPLKIFLLCLLHSSLYSFLYSADTQH